MSNLEPDIPAGIKILVLIISELGIPVTLKTTLSLSPLLLCR